MQKTIYYNTLALSALRIGTPLISMVLIAIVSRTLGAEPMGAYSLILTICNIFATCGQLGLQSLIVREVAISKSKAASRLSASLYVGTASSLAFILIMHMSVGLISDDANVQHGLRVISWSILPSCLASYIEGFFLAFEKMKLIVYEQAIANIARVLISLSLIYFGFGLNGLVIGSVAASILGLVLCVILYLVHISPRISVKADPEFLRQLLTNSPTFLSIALSSIISWKIDIVILSKMCNLTEVAIYTAAYKLFDNMLILPQAYMRAFFPQLACKFNSDRAEFLKMTRGIIKNSAFYVFCIVSVTVFLAWIPIKIVYGPEFTKAEGILRILTFGLVPWAGARICAYILLAAGKSAFDLFSGIVATVVNVALNFLLIPSLGSTGSALATLISLTVFFVANLLCTKRIIPKVTFLRQLAWPAIAGIAVALLAIVASSHVLLAALILSVAGLIMWGVRSRRPVHKVKVEIYDK